MSKIDRKYQLLLNLEALCRRRAEILEQKALMMKGFKDKLDKLDVELGEVLAQLKAEVSPLPLFERPEVVDQGGGGPVD